MTALQEADAELASLVPDTSKGKVGHSSSKAAIKSGCAAISHTARGHDCSRLHAAPHTATQCSLCRCVLREAAGLLSGGPHGQAGAQWELLQSESERLLQQRHPGSERCCRWGRREHWQEVRICLA